MTVDQRMHVLDVVCAAAGLILVLYELRVRKLKREVAHLRWWHPDQVRARAIDAYWRESKLCRVCETYCGGRLTGGCRGPKWSATVVKRRDSSHVVDECGCDACIKQRLAAAVRP